jgi:hypothetical protein
MKKQGRNGLPRAALSSRSDGQEIARSCLENVALSEGSQTHFADMHSDMNFLRSSPFIPFDLVLQAPILVS